MRATAEQVEYRDVPGFPGYRVGSDGSVWSQMRTNGKRATTWRRLKAAVNGNGYKKVTLHRRTGGKREFRQVYVHRVVLLAFVGECPVDKQCCHNDGVRTNNRLANLRYGSAKDNATDRDRHGRTPRGERVGNAKLNEADVRIIREMFLREDRTKTEIARCLGVSRGTVKIVLAGGTWAHAN